MEMGMGRLFLPYFKKHKLKTMPKVTVSQTFIGSVKEMETYGGRVPAEYAKREKNMSKEEKNSFSGKITAGTEMEVSDQRAKELAKLGLIENPEKYWTKSDQAEAEKAKVTLFGEKVTDAAPVKKAETGGIPVVGKKKGGK
jgi:hypothetical protein